MCLYTLSIKEAAEGLLQPYNKPYNDGKIRFKCLIIDDKELLSPTYTHMVWTRGKWHTSSRRSGKTIDRPGTIYNGFHFYIDGNTALANRSSCEVVVAFEVKDFIAAGTNNGRSRGEVWHRAKPVGFVRYNRNRSSYQIVPFKK